MAKSTSKPASESGKQNQSTGSTKVQSKVGTLTGVPAKGPNRGKK